MAICCSCHTTPLEMSMRTCCQKVNQTNHIEQINTVVQVVSSLGCQDPQRLPHSSSLHFLKLILHAITSWHQMPRSTDRNGLSSWGDDAIQHWQLLVDCRLEENLSTMSSVPGTSCQNTSHAQQYGKGTATSSVGVTPCHNLTSKQNQFGTSW